MDETDAGRRLYKDNLAEDGSEFADSRVLGIAVDSRGMVIRGTLVTSACGLSE